MILNSCPRCARPARAEGASWRCDYCKRTGRIANIRKRRELHLASPGERQCKTPGCGRRLGRMGLCWTHYRKLRKREPARAHLSRGFSRKDIGLMAMLRRQEGEAKKQRQDIVRELMFDKARGQLMRLPRKERRIISNLCHEAYERAKLRPSFFFSYLSYRRRWYGWQKAIWVRTVARRTKERFKAMNETSQSDCIPSP